MIDEALIASLRETHALATALLDRIYDQPWSERQRWREWIRPEPGDWERVFLPPWAEQAREGYAELWDGGVAPDRGANPGEVSISGVIPAEMFASDNRASRQHPGGYLYIAHTLQPSMHWVSWRQGGTSHNGLVRLDDRFAWFPKPWMVLRGA